MENQVDSTCCNETKQCKPSTCTKKKYFTWKELSKLNMRENAHVAYKQKVYDVSSFVSRHPGGVEQIMAGAGHDITEVFKVYHKKDTFERVLSKYYVGELVDNRLPVFANETDKLYETIKSRVEEHVKLHKLDPKVDYGMFAVYFVTLSLYIASTYLMLYFGTSPMKYIPFAAMCGILTTTVGFHFGHDASHFSLTHKPFIWKTMGMISSVISGLSMYIWCYQHVLGHHPFTNVEGIDPDIDTGPEEIDAIWRIKSSQRWISRFMYQYIYMPILMTMLSLKIKIQDMIDIFTLTKGGLPMNPPSTLQMIEFWVIKASHVFVRFIIPFMYMPLFDFVVASLVFEASCGFTWGQLTQLNHVTSKVDWIKPDADMKIHIDWSVLQVTTTQDYCTDSIFWTLFTGSLNHQVAHHLFPGYIQSHYRWITPIIKKTCAEFGVQYNCVDSITECLGLHYNYIKKMGLDHVD